MLSETATLKCCLRKKSATLSCASFSPSSGTSPVRAASFQASVSGSRRRTNHLSTGEELTPRTQHAESNHQGQHDRIGNKIAPLTVNRFIMATAYAHEADPRDVDGDYRRAGEQRPQDIPGGPPVFGPLRDAHPAQECERHVGERRAGGHYDHVTRAIGKMHHIACSIRT